MQRIEARIEARTEVTRQFMRFARKAMEEINRLHENTLRNGEEMTSTTKMARNYLMKLKFYYLMRKIFLLWVATYRQRALINANEIWSKDERMHFCIEPRKALSSDQKAADDERADILRKTMGMIMKKYFSEARYHNILRYVNQQGVDLQKKKKKTEQENIPPVDEN